MRRLHPGNWCLFSVLLLRSVEWLVRVTRFRFFGARVLTGVLVVVGVTVGGRIVVVVVVVVLRVGIVVVVMISVVMMTVVTMMMIMFGSEANLFLYFAEILAGSHGIFQTQSRNLLNNRLHDNLDTGLHRPRQG